MNNLRVARKHCRMTQEEVAKHVNVSQNAYSYWESGKTNVDMASMAKLADLFKVSTDFLSGKSYIKLRVPFEDWRDDWKEDYQSADDDLKKYLLYKYGQPIYDETQAFSIENSVIGNHNSNCCNTSSIQPGNIEKEILDLCGKMTAQQKIALLSRAYELLENK